MKSNGIWNLLTGVSPPTLKDLSIIYLFELFFELILLPFYLIFKNRLEDYFNSIFLFSKIFCISKEEFDKSFFNSKFLI